MQTNSITKCTKCGKAKQISEFYTSKLHKRGYDFWCKDCQRKSARERMKKRYADPNIRKSILQQQKEFSQTQRGREIHRKANKKYDKSPKGKSAQRRNYAKNKYKIYARSAISRATRQSILPKAKTLMCKICDNKAIEYHHESYDKENWLDVIPICKQCHINIHII